MISARHGQHGPDRCCLYCYIRARVYTGPPLPADLSEEDRIARRVMLEEMPPEGKGETRGSWEWLANDRARTRKVAGMLHLMESTGDQW